jgi:hypothetical protein
LEEPPDDVGPGSFSYGESETHDDFVSRNEIEPDRGDYFFPHNYARFD